MTHVLELVQQRGQVCVLRACVFRRAGAAGRFPGTWLAAYMNKTDKKHLLSHLA
jgi:hypothetical protein